MPVSQAPRCRRPFVGRRAAVPSTCRDRPKSCRRRAIWRLFGPRDVYVEIQGHTDSTGSEAYNQQLGLERAEAVRRYLSRGHGFALHRLSVVSYGESEPAVDNDTRENRSRSACRAGGPEVAGK